MLTVRQNKILEILIDDYLKTAEPVGSLGLVDKLKENISSATVRNEFSVLEDVGLIIQPHTSAGRIPTEKGYRYYLQNLLQERDLSIKQAESLKASVIKELSQESRIRNLAKIVSEISKNAVLVGFGPQNVYYTGLSNLFAQPEFRDYNLVRHMSRIIDHLDEVMNGIFNEVKDLTIWVGKENPFGSNCSVVFHQYQSDDSTGIFGILGPTRMDYQKNIALVKNINNLLRKG